MARLFTAANSDLISIAQSALYNAANYSIVAWIKRASIGTNQVIFSKDGVAGKGYDFYFDVNDKLNLVHQGVANITTTTATASTSVFYHVAVTYDGTNARIYINGALDSTNALAAPIDDTTTAQVIGARVTTPALFFDGIIGDIAYYSTPLTLGEIAGLASGARPFMVRRASMNGYFPLDGIGSPEPDLSGNGLNGTLTGTAYANGPPVWPYHVHRRNTLYTVSAGAAAVIPWPFFNMKAA